MATGATTKMALSPTDDDALDDECIHGLGRVEDCVLCNGRAKREALERSNVVIRIFEARFPGKCPWCGDRFDAGSRIGLTSQEQYVCAVCAEQWRADHD